MSLFERFMSYREGRLDAVTNPPAPCGDDLLHCNRVNQGVACIECQEKQDQHEARERSREENRKMVKQAKYVVDEMVRAQREGRLQ